MNKKMFDITTTFLELGDFTSHNLELSQSDDVCVSYGEETITELNLLEIARRHPDLVRIRTYSKRKEGTNGADWEWHIIGRERKYKMRVQAKRIQSNDVLKIKHEVKSSGKQQRDLLINEAIRDNMKPVYCIYSKEDQRKTWKEFRSSSGYGSFQAGCLLADAKDVPLDATRLEQIENKCIPWHFLFHRNLVYKKVDQYVKRSTGEPVRFVQHKQIHFPTVASSDIASEHPELSDISDWNPPTIRDLNNNTVRDFDRTGVEETSNHNSEFKRFDDGYFMEKRIFRIVVIDVRDIAEDRILH